MLFTEKLSNQFLQKMYLKQNVLVQIRARDIITCTVYLYSALVHGVQQCYYDVHSFGNYVKHQSIYMYVIFTNVNRIFWVKYL